MLTTSPLLFMTLLHTFPKGPPLKLQVELKDQKLHKTYLKMAPCFSCEFLGSVETSISNKVFSWLESYGQGEEPKIELPLFLEEYSPFQRKILENMKKVSFGSLLSYQGLAQAAGNNKASRAVGNVCRDNPFPLFIPCHRIIKTDGSLGGFAYGLIMKKILLQFEGTLN